MGFETPTTGISLDTFSDCPYCRRPLLGLASDRCSYCGRSLESCFSTLPEVASRLNQIARGWTPASFLEWACPRPAQLLWALSTGHWKQLGYWTAEDLWRLWARLFANLSGRWRPRNVEMLQVETITLCAIGEFQPWVTLRIRGRRADYHWNRETGEPFQGSTEPAPFQELWTFMPTGQPIEKTEHQCSVCAGGIAFEDLECPYCGCPVTPVPGPWMLVAVHADPEGSGTYRSPFDASVSNLPTLE